MFSWISTQTSCWTNGWNAASLRGHVAHMMIWTSWRRVSDLMQLVNFVRSFGTSAINLRNYWKLEQTKFTLFAWWPHQMEPFSALLAFCGGNPSVTGGFPSQRQMTRSFGVFFDLRLIDDLKHHSAHYDTTVLGQIGHTDWLIPRIARTFANTVTAK